MTDNIQVVRVLSTTGAPAGVSSLPSARLPLEIAVESVRVTPTGGIEQNMGDALGGNRLVTPGTAPYVINGNSNGEVPSSYLTGTLLEVIGTPGAVARVAIEGYGAAPTVAQVRANGTPSSPTKTLATNGIAVWSSRGHDGTDRTGVAFTLNVFAAEDYTSSVNGSRATLQVTKSGTNTLLQAMSWENDGATTIKSLPPASASATGVAGTITWASGFVYICVATDTWQRGAIATW